MVIALVVMSSILGRGFWTLAGFVMMDLVDNSSTPEELLRRVLPTAEHVVPNLRKPLLLQMRSRADRPSDASWVHEMLDSASSVTAHEPPLLRSQPMVGVSL